MYDTYRCALAIFLIKYVEYLDFWGSGESANKGNMFVIELFPDATLKVFIIAHSNVYRTCNNIWRIFAENIVLICEEITIPRPKNRQKHNARSKN